MHARLPQSELFCETRAVEPQEFITFWKGTEVGSKITIGDVKM